MSWKYWSSWLKTGIIFAIVYSVIYIIAQFLDLVGSFILIAFNPYLLLIPESILSIKVFFDLVTFFLGISFYFLIGVISAKLIIYLSKFYFFNLIFRFWFIPATIVAFILSIIPFGGLIMIPFIFLLLSFFDLINYPIGIHFSEYGSLNISNIFGYILIIGYYFFLFFIIYKIRLRFKKKEIN